MNGEQEILPAILFIKKFLNNFSFPNEKNLKILKKNNFSNKTNRK